MATLKVYVERGGKGTYYLEREGSELVLDFYGNLESRSGNVVERLYFAYHRIGLFPGEEFRVDYLNDLVEFWGDEVAKGLYFDNYGSHICFHSKSNFCRYGRGMYVVREVCANILIDALNTFFDKVVVDALKADVDYEKERRYHEARLKEYVLSWSETNIYELYKEFCRYANGGHLFPGTLTYLPYFVEERRVYEYVEMAKFCGMIRHELVDIC